MSVSFQEERYFRSYLDDPDEGILQVTSVSGSASIDFGSINDGETSAVQFALVGAVAGSAIAIGPPATLEAKISITAFVPATNVIEIRATYHSTGAGPTAINPAIGTYKVTVFIV